MAARKLFPARLLRVACAIGFLFSIAPVAAAAPNIVNVSPATSPQPSPCDGVDDWDQR